MKKQTIENLGWKIILLTVLVFSGEVSASQFFQECSVALEKPEFATLKKHLDTNQKLPRPNQCFRLNNKQFLLTVTDTNRVGQGLYYYDAITNSFGLDGGRYSLVSVDREFTGLNNKRYVLLSFSNISQGRWSQEYTILNLVPTKNRKSYIHYSLLSWSEDPVSGLCGERISTGKARSIKAPQISNEGTESVQVVFPVTEQDCVTHKKTMYSKTFALRDGVFKEVQN